MIVDSSALMAIIHAEPEATSFAHALIGASARRISAATFVELGVVADRIGTTSTMAGVDEYIARYRLTIEPVTEEQARIAREAYRTYGRGSGHPARLNFGDCFPYALAKVTGEPLLFKGRDFAQTDITFVGPLAERQRISEILGEYAAG